MSNSKKVVELLFINKKYKNKCEPVYEGLEGFLKAFMQKTADISSN